MASSAGIPNYIIISTWWIDGPTSHHHMIILIHIYLYILSEYTFFFVGSSVDGNILRRKPFHLCEFDITSTETMSVCVSV